MFLRPYTGSVRLLRRLTDNPSLVIEVDEDETIEKDVACWNVLVIDQGEPTWICDWVGPLDGCMDAIALKVRMADSRVVGRKEHYARLDEKLKKARATRRKDRIDRWRGVTQYMKKAFKRLAYSGDA